MNHVRISNILTVLFVVVLCYGPVGLAGPLGTAFTYQGRLIDANNAADGLYDLQFLVCEVDTNGVWPIGEVNKPEVDVIDGYFTVELDFGDVFYDYGEDLWLEIGVRPGDLNDPNVYTFLSPLQKITPTPYALYAKTAGNVFGMISGTGTSNYIPKFISYNSIGNSVIYESAGNVGIGTIYPTAKMEVAGQVKITGGSPAAGKILTSDAYGLANWQTLIETDPTVLASVKDGVSWGEVSGIPAGFADGVDDVGLTSETDPTVLASVKDGISWGEVSGIPAGFADGIDDVGAGDNLGNHTATQNIKLSGYWLSGDGGNEGVYVANSGNVGIGTTSPDQKLTVADGTIKATNSLTTGMAVYGLSNNTGFYTNYGGYFEAAGFNGRGVYGKAYLGPYLNYGGYFEAGGIGVYGQGMTGGYFLGTGSGSSVYGVYGEANNASVSINYGGYFKAAGTTGRGVYGYASGANGFGVYGEANNTDDYTHYGGYFRAEGSVGRGVLGYASGTSGKGVVGYGGTAETSYDFDATGPGVNYGATSSIRWKKDIKAIDEPLEKVMQLRGVYFNWDEEHGGHHDVGMIAEEVGKVLPEIVVYEPNSIYTSGMDYSKTTPLLVEAIKALKVENDELKRRLAVIEAAIGKNNGGYKQ